MNAIANPRYLTSRFGLLAGLLFLMLGAALLAPSSALANVCDGKQTITANVVVLDNPTVFNRLGAQNPNYITYALKRDVIHKSGGKAGEVCQLPDGSDNGCQAGNVELRPDKRPRPLVVRSVAGACLTVNFTNLLAPNANPNDVQQGPPQGQPGALFNDDQVAGRCAGFHASGTELVSSTLDDGSFVGQNQVGDDVTANCSDGDQKGSLVGPNGSITYNLYTPHEGAFVINSYGATLGSEANAGNLGLGMFGALNVQSKGARIYRSQVHEEELRLATTDLTPSDCTAGDVVGVDCNPGGQPIIDYEATYPNREPWISEGKAGLPILNMLHNGELVHSDINAIIVGSGPNGTFPNDTYPLESTGSANVPSLPNRLEPYREFTSVFHDEQTNAQVFPLWYNNPVLGHTVQGVRDAFMINYASGGIGSEIIANRLHTGPMHDCTDCAYEEFFLASQTVGDPGGLVNWPANTGIEACDPTNILDPACWRQWDDGAGNLIVANPPIRVDDGKGGYINNYALFSDDPANIHNSYTGDFVKIRNIHAGAFEQHIFHLHNHQWLFNPNDDNGNYLDAQEIMPGSGHTYELVNGGVGNRNKTAGDAIFHCHFYPHFAQGMWYHIRIQDTFQRGTVLEVSNASDPQAPRLPPRRRFRGQDFHNEVWALRSGRPAAGARALPDAELPDGWPIPAIVPLPGKPMPQMPATVTVKAVDRGDFGVVAGRTPPNGLGQGPDSAQAVVYRDCSEDGAPAGCIGAFGPDGVLGGGDDRNPGYPFWLAGNECGPGAGATDAVCNQGTVGQRMPTPVLDMLTDTDSDGDGVVDDTPYLASQAGGWDGGLPRHNLLGYTAGGISLDTQNRLDFRKVVEIAHPVYHPELGTDLEQVAMAYHAVRNRPSVANKLAGTGTTTGNFVLNGSDPVPGGPFNDPCVDDAGTYLGHSVVGEWFDGDNDPATLGTLGGSVFHGDNPRTYKIANVQIDAVFNKVGHHYPQERIIALWEDVAPTVNKQRPPEPLVMRFNTFDCGKILHANLVPAEYELDDFQVRTPTDIIGQHIHLPKWDLTTGDGAANGWNYEDGTLSPIMVQERIHAINNFNDIAGETIGLVAAAVQLGFDDKVHPNVVDLLSANNTTLDLTDLAPVPTLTVAQGADPGSPSLVGRAPGDHLVAASHPFFGTGQEIETSAGLKFEYKGARTTIQRILVDPVVNVAGVDRGLGLTFSHDHYGPSTFQQIGLYSTILAEPAGSTWYHNESGAQLATGRSDGGPTSWQAVILPPEEAPNGSTVKSENIPDHREFYFEMSDFQHAYNAGTYVGGDATGRPILTAVQQPVFADVTRAKALLIQDKWQQAVNPTLKLMANGGFPDLVTAHGACPGLNGGVRVQNAPDVPRPCAEAINVGHSSTWVVNYRNEPVGLRVFDPDAVGPDGQTGAQAAGQAGDLAFAFSSSVNRAIPQLNTSFGDTPAGWQNAPYCMGANGDLINCDRNLRDPFTPMMRAYERDEVKIKIQVGATEEQHQSTVHGIKWLSNGSGFGRSPNSGWRSFQSHGISEQFSLQVPMNPDPNQRGNTVDYLYATDATRDGFWLGTWGILRSYGQSRRDLQELPDNPVTGVVQVRNENEFAGVCPAAMDPVTLDPIIDPDTDMTVPANLVQYDLTAVLANDVLPNNLGVTIPANDPAGDNAGGPLNPAGGTLVYNRRSTVVSPGMSGPLNDPTAMLYVRTEDLEPVDPTADVCSLDPSVNPNAVDTDDNMVADTVPDMLRSPADTVVQATSPLQIAGCPLRLKASAPVEPVVLRANAGQCIEVTLRNRLPEVAPDLAGWQSMMWAVTRRIENAGTGAEMYFFDNNLIRPSSHVGLHAQLVEYDASRDDGLPVGGNATGGLTAEPGGAKVFQFYAGNLRHDRLSANEFEIVATPVEFGGTNLLSADRIKQPQKGLFGALVIEPADATYPDALADLEQVPDGQGSGSDTRKTRAQVTVTSPEGDAGSGGTYREALVIGHKIANIRWADGSAIRNVHQGEFGVEGAEDNGHAGFNYAMEPSWFRFKLPPDAPFGNAGMPASYGSLPNVHAFFANGLVASEPNAIPAIPGVSAAGDPQTPVFRATADAGGTNPRSDTRMHVLNGASADRDGTFILHGHVWPRDPYVCTGSSQDGSVALPGRCDPTEPVPSQALGDNKQAKYMGGEEGMGHVYGHWPILFDAGGSGRVGGDYLFTDYAPNGKRNGQFGLLRVAAPDLCAGNQPPIAEANGPYSAKLKRGKARVSFTSAGSHDDDGSIDAYLWDFGDGNTSTQPNPTHTYRQRGTFTATLKVTDNCGVESLVDTAEVTIN